MKLKFLVLIIITILLSFTLTSSFYLDYMLQGVIELDIEMEVGDVVGLDTDTSVISFGIVPLGGSAQRKVEMENTGYKPIKVYISKIGEIAEWVSISENNFILWPSVKKEILFTVNLSEKAGKGIYGGKARFVLRRLL